jgi:hypothetical protein
VQRRVSILVVPVLLVLTVAAFVGTEALKLSKPLLTLFDVRDTSHRHISHLTFSPTCRCPSATAHLGVRFRSPMRVAVQVVDEDGNVVRHLVSEKRVKAIGLRWNGRTDAARVAPDGHYRFRLDLPHRTVLMPNVLTLDTTPPKVKVRVANRTFSPDGDGRRDRVFVSYSSPDQLFDVRLRVRGAGKTWTVHAGRRRTGFRLTWPTAGAGKAASLPEGQYQLQLAGRDLAGNAFSERAGNAIVRYVTVEEPTRSVTGGDALDLDLDTRRIHWRFEPLAGGHPVRGTSFLAHDDLRLIVPKGLPGGIYRLVVRIPSGRQTSIQVAVRGPTKAPAAVYAPTIVKQPFALPTGITEVDGLTGLDLTNLELVASYRTLVLPPGGSVDPGVMRNYRKTGGKVLQSSGPPG